MSSRARLKIVSAVCACFEIKRKDMMSVTRLNEIVEARQVAFYLIRKMLKASYRSIGEDFGRDHTTVGFGCRQIVRRIRHDKILKSKINILRIQIAKKLNT